jgi:hypothetical protein
MLENGVAFDTLENSVGKRQSLRAGADIDSGSHDDIQIDVPIGCCSGAADIEVPASQRSVDFQLFRVVKDRSRRRKQAEEAMAKPRGMPTLIEKLDTLRVHKVG